MANLNTRYPNLYLTSNCSFCNQHENTEHLLLYTLHSIDFHNILLIQITDYLNTLSLTNTAPQTILQHILLNSNPPDLTNTFLLLIQEIISTNCYEQINSLLKKSTNNFFIQLFNNLLLWFQAKIWNARNLIYHKWESARGISKRNKTNSKTSHLLQTPNILNTTTTYNLNIDNFIQKCLLQNFSIYNCIF